MKSHKTYLLLFLFSFTIVSMSQETEAQCSIQKDLVKAYTNVQQAFTKDTPKEVFVHTTWAEADYTKEVQDMLARLKNVPKEQEAKAAEYYKVKNLKEIDAQFIWKNQTSKNMAFMPADKVQWLECFVSLSGKSAVIFTKQDSSFAAYEFMKKADKWIMTEFSFMRGKRVFNSMFGAGYEGNDKALSTKQRESKVKMLSSPKSNAIKGQIPKVKIDDIEHLWIECSLTEMYTEHSINGNEAGSGNGGFGIGVATYGGMAGSNVVSFKMKNPTTEKSEMTCFFYDKSKSKGMDHTSLSKFSVKPGSLKVGDSKDYEFTVETKASSKK